LKKLLFVFGLLIFMGCEEEKAEPSPLEDCLDVPGGTATIDDCGICDDNPENDCVQDCNGEWGGTAYENLCEFCVGGNTELDTTYCGTVTDIEGNIYNAVLIGDQVWMAENLKVTYYQFNGDMIPSEYDNSDWGELTTGAYAVYPTTNNETSLATCGDDCADIYGNLYNWYAVIDVRGICPEGWHVPTDDEWTTLERYICSELGGHSNCEEEFPYGFPRREWRGTDEGGMMKEPGTEHWNDPNTGATNESGFNALPSGRRSSSGHYNRMGTHSYFWSSTEYYDEPQWRFGQTRELHYNRSEVNLEIGGKEKGFCVRCVRD
jgi:uncharacterized protein (TIGR02145 family)